MSLYAVVLDWLQTRRYQVTKPNSLLLQCGFFTFKSSSNEGVTVPFEIADESPREAGGIFAPGGEEDVVPVLSVLVILIMTNMTSTPKSTASLPDTGDDDLSDVKAVVALAEGAATHLRPNSR